MSRSEKNTTFGMFLLLLIISSFIAGLGQALLSGFFVIAFGLSGINSILIHAVIGIIIFVFIWIMLYRVFFRGRTFR